MAREFFRENKTPEYRNKGDERRRQAGIREVFWAPGIASVKALKWECLALLRHGERYTRIEAV